MITKGMEFPFFFLHIGIMIRQLMLPGRGNLQLKMAPKSQQGLEFPVRKKF
jgi:hypothetical protein